MEFNPVDLVLNLFLVLHICDGVQNLGGSNRVVGLRMKLRLRHLLITQWHRWGPQNMHMSGF